MMFMSCPAMCPGNGSRIESTNGVKTVAAIWADAEAGFGISVCLIFGGSEYPPNAKWWPYNGRYFGPALQFLI